MTKRYAMDDGGGLWPLGRDYAGPGRVRAPGEAEMLAKNLDGRAQRVVAFLAGLISREDLASVVDFLTPGAMDDPPAFLGRPTVGGNPLSAGAQDRLIARVRLALDGAPGDVRRFVFDRFERREARAADAFARQFPNATRIAH